MVTFSQAAGLDTIVEKTTFARPGVRVDTTAALVPSPQSTAVLRSL